jgi:hypothetical protein
MGDLDVGEMLLNFILELKARIRGGVDLTHSIAFAKEVVNETPNGSTPSGPCEAREPDPHQSASRRAQPMNRRSAVGRRSTPHTPLKE